MEIALKLREEGKNKESNQLLIKLAEAFPTEAILQYQCAWSFDVLGEEAKAAPITKERLNMDSLQKN